MRLKLILSIRIINKLFEPNDDEYIDEIYKKYFAKSLVVYYEKEKCKSEYE